MFWSQGFDSAPALVRGCVASWGALNPKWQLVTIDSVTVRDWISIDLPPAVWNKMQLAHQSGYIRLKLLARYGGVWADATVLALRPLDGWLPGASGAGFFAFSWERGDVLYSPQMRRTLRVGRSKTLASWFMAAEANNYLVSTLCNGFASYWMYSLGEDFSADGEARLGRRLMRSLVSRMNWLHPALAAVWVHPFIANVVKIRPYLVMNAVFSSLLATDRQFRAIWKATPAFPAVNTHRLQEVGLEPFTSARLIRGGLAEVAPVQKLNWRAGWSSEDVEKMLVAIQSGLGA